MPRPKQINEPVRLPALVERSTYQALINQSSNRSINEGRLISLAEHVRQILDQAVANVTAEPESDTKTIEREEL